VLALSVSRTGDRRPKDGGGVNHHYKACKEITSKEASKQIFLYSMMTTWMTCESLKRDNYRFTSRWELHIYSPWARLSLYLWRLIYRCDWRSCRNRSVILDTLREFCRKILGYVGLLIGCHSIPLRSDHDYDLVAFFDTHGFECGCLLFPADVEFLWS
jgi:hypothetical protein